MPATDCAAPGNLAFRRSFDGADVEGARNDSSESVGGETALLLELFALFASLALGAVSGRRGFDFGAPDADLFCAAMLDRADEAAPIGGFWEAPFRVAERPGF